MAKTATSPLAVMSLSRTNTHNSEERGLEKLEPTSASTVADSKFAGAHPMVLKARVTPTALPPSEVMALLLVARMCALLSPLTETPPSLAVTSLLAMYALAEFRMALVAITPPAARPGAPPPVAVACASACAKIVASSFARIETDPAFSVTFSTKAFTTERTSLRTMMPPTATDGVETENKLSSANSVAKLAAAWSVLVLSGTRVDLMPLNCLLSMSPINAIRQTDFPEASFSRVTLVCSF